MESLIKYWPIFFAFPLLLAQSSEVQQGLYLGEKKWEHYIGPFDPLQKESKDTFDDENFYQQYIDRQLIPHAPQLEDFLEDDLLTHYECPLGMMALEFRYMRYLYRLLSLSFIFEELREIQRISVKMKLGGSTCKVDWKQFLNRCDAKSDEMKKFTQRSTHYIKNLKDFKYLENKSLISQKKWIEKYLRGKLSGRDKIVGTRLSLWCKNNQCNKLNSKNLGKALYGMCLEDISLFYKICSEKDDFYGLYSLPMMTKLLGDSHIANLLDKKMNTKACLFKFSSYMKKRENIPNYIYPLFTEVNSQLLAQKDSRYRQGMLFLPGSLQEFDQKGLNDFLYKPAPKKVPVKPVIVATATPFPTAAPIPTAVPTPTPVPTVVPTAVPIRISYFGRQVKRFESRKLERLKIRLEIFKRDYVFSEKVKKKLNKELARFLKRKALKEMRVNDKLGTNKAPLPILFLKFFIESENYQALYNIIGELGHEFYVFNDIDKSGKPVMVELKFKTKDWSLYLVREKKKKLLKKKGLKK